MSIFWMWQLWPAYAVAAAWLLPRRWRWTRRAALAATGAAAIGVWLVLPWPWLPEPAGPYGVGTRIYRWVDASRAETTPGAEGERRQVIAQVFYPAARGTAGREAPYLDGIGRLPPSVAGVPRRLLDEAARVRTHAFEGAARALEGAPVVLFSPGYGAPRGFYTALVTEWASRGLEVVAVDHPYEAGVAELAGGAVVGNVTPPARGEGGLIRYMERQQALRTADLRFVLDQLEKQPGWGQGRRVVAVGHSFGGASSMALLTEDARIAAAVNIDGTPYGDLPGRRFDRPVLLIESDPALGKHGEKFRAGNGRILAGAAHAMRVTMPGVNHFGFTDLAYFLSPPGRWAMGRVLGGGREAGEVRRVTVELVEGVARGQGTGEAVRRAEWVRAW